MSFLDKIASAVLPAASEEDRAEVRRRAESLAPGNPWLEQVLDHHRQILAGFDKALSATGADARRQAIRDMAVVLIGHSNAEEAVLYPFVVEYGGKVKAAMAYEEQAVTKVQLAKLEKLDPMSHEWREKVEHIKSAVEQHMYQEEGSWFPALVEQVPAEQRPMMNERFMEEFSRYADGEPQAVVAPPSATLAG